MKRVSVFHKEKEEKKRVKEKVPTQKFLAAYWLVKIGNQFEENFTI